MDKRYLPAIASILIIAMVAASVLPVYAATMLVRAQARPTVVVTTIAEDDEARKTGIIILADSLAGFQGNTPILAQKLLAQFKILIAFNGIPITASIVCQVIEKDKTNPIKNRQFPAENLASTPKDASSLFVCKYREIKPGVGVLDVYYTGPVAAQQIADYVLVVGATVTIGRNTVFGTEIQDICILGWPFVEAPAWMITKPDGTNHWIWADPLDPFVSCEDMALVEHNVLGLPIAWT